MRYQLTSRITRHAAVLISTLAITAAGLTVAAVAAPARVARSAGGGHHAPTARMLPAAKVKCVNRSTGFARYASNGQCRRSERIDRRACRRGGSCVVGDIGPGRGRVFYSARTRQPWGRYLEAAPSTWSSPAGDPNLMWCSDVVDAIPNTQATGLGAGKANTAAMLSRCTTDAAVAASSYRGGGKADWYLPSRDELRQLFVHQRAVGPFIFHGYWSSSEYSANEAWVQDFYADYTPAPSDKSYANYVRPIRAFG